MTCCNNFIRVFLFTGLDYWTGLLDWTTGLTQTTIKYLFSVGQRLYVHAHLAYYFANGGSLAGQGVFPMSVEVKGYMHI